MSYLYSLVARLFTSVDQKVEQHTEPLIQQSVEQSVEQLSDQITLNDMISEIQTDQDKITELERLAKRLEARLVEAYHENKALQSLADNLTNEKKHFENQYNRECEKNRVLCERFLKEPDVTTLFAGLDNMTINQFKNVIPKMDLSEFSDLTTKDKYFNACMFMFVRKFNSTHLDYNSNEFIDYVLNNDSLTVSVREYLNNNQNIAMVRKELCDFYEFAKMFAD
jgi:hypothetical protein